MLRHWVARFGICDGLAKGFSQSLVGSVINFESRKSVDDQAAALLVSFQVRAEGLVLIVCSVLQGTHEGN